MQRLWFRLHQILGLVSALVLLVVTGSGVLYAFEDRVVAWAADIEVPSEGAEAALGAPALLDKLTDHGWEGLPRLFLWESRADQPAWVRIQEGDRSRNLLMDPYTGEFLVEATSWKLFFLGVLELHRTLYLGVAGEVIVGACAVVLVLVIISGLLYSWGKDRRLFRLRNARGRVTWGSLHRGLGWYAAPLLVVSALTGLFWSFDAYRHAVYAITFSQPPPAPPQPVLEAGGQTAELERVWKVATAYLPEKARARRLVLPSDAAQPLVFAWQPENSPASSVRDTLYLHPQTAEPLRHDKVADFSAGYWAYRMAYPIHTGRIGGVLGQGLMALVAALGFFLSLSGGWIFLRRQHLRRRRRTGHHI